VSDHFHLARGAVRKANGIQAQVYDLTPVNAA